jgi:hypothetical protein
MQETYTFSRALHLMRYGGKKMRCVNSLMYKSRVYRIINRSLYYQVEDGIIETALQINASDIMGSWVEVK